MSNKHIIYIDGDCIICNKMISFLLKRDRQLKYMYCPLQSDYAKSQLPNHLLIKDELETVVLQDNRGNIYTHAEAIIKIISGLGGLWRLVSIFRIVPQKVSNYIYSWFARRRYLFGSMTVCDLPDSSLSSRIIS